MAAWLHGTKESLPLKHRRDRERNDAVFRIADERRKASTDSSEVDNPGIMITTGAPEEEVHPCKGDLLRILRVGA